MGNGGEFYHYILLLCALPHVERVALSKHPSRFN